jgi:hypothetical protein
MFVIAFQKYFWKKINFNFNFFFGLIFFIFSNYFNLLILTINLKNKKYYFNIFLNKNTFEQKLYR